LGAPSIGLAGGGVLVADGQLQDALVPPRWGVAGSDGRFAVFTDRFAAGPLTVQPLPGKPGSGQADSGQSGSGQSGSGRSRAGSIAADGASVHYTTSVPGDVTTARVSSARGVRLVRSVAAIPGWSATWQPRGGSPVTLPVQRDGVVQSVDVPPGQGVVTWHYTSPRFTAGLVMSVAGAVFVALLLVAGGRRRPATRPAPRRQLESQAT
ncbi:MAG: hypothetical protein J2P25_19050, partial [Nocardiopsaceae bacterium]|nr:hypothetical protein [Nocardiopsaceae bacterium]